MTSELKVDKITPASGTSFTLGDSGDTFTVPSGATLDTSSSTLSLPSTIITSQTEKSSLVDADKFLISDSAASGALKYVQNSNLGGGAVELLSTASRTSGSAAQVYMTDFMDNSKYLFYRAMVSAKNAGNGNSQFFNFTSSGGSTMEQNSWSAAVNQVKNANGSVSNNTGDGGNGSNKMTWVTNESTRAFAVEFIMTPYGVVTDAGLSSVHFIGQSDRWSGSSREVQCITGAGYYTETTTPTGFVIGAIGGNWERYEIRVYGYKKA